MKKKTSIKYQEKDHVEKSDFNFYIDTRSFGVETLNSEKFDYLHWHDYFELEVILEGRGTHHFNDHPYEISPGSAYIITPVDFHSVSFDRGYVGKILHIQFDSLTLSPEVIDIIAASSSQIAAQLDSDLLDYVCVLCEKMVSEFKSDSLDRRFMIRALLEQLCLIIVRKSSTSSAVTRQASRDETILQVVNYLNYNFRHKISLQQLANKYMLNANYLGEKFNKTIGISFTSYVNDLRLSYAMRLLRNSDMSIKQISSESGFSSVSYFIKLFSMKYGSAPQRMRNDNSK